MHLNIHVCFIDIWHRTLSKMSSIHGFLERHQRNVILMDMDRGAAMNSESRHIGRVARIQ